jgi:hypothetical protein
MIAITVRTEKLLNGLPTIGRQQLPFGLSVGINKTLEDIQATQRRGIQQRFTLRKPSFVLGMVRIRKEDFAKKDNLVGRVRIGGFTPDGKMHGKADFGALLVRHEPGGTFHGGYFVPTKAVRPSFSQLIEKTMRPWALGLWRTDRQIAARTMGEARRRGKQRTFSIVNREGQFLIFQRFGLRNSDIRRRVKKGLNPTAAERMDEGIRLLWARVPSIRLQPRLQFGDTARLIVRSRLANNVEAGMLRALRTAKVGGGVR